MCVGDDGAVNTVWSDDREGVQAVYFNRSSDGGLTWLASPTKLSHSTGSAILPDISCSGTGLHVVWQDSRDGVVENGNIYYSMSADNGQSWLPEDLALDADPQGDSNSRAPRIASNGPKVYVTWFDSFRGGYDIFAVSSSDSVVFTEPERIDVSDPPGASFSAWPQIAVVAGSDGRDNVMLMWEDSRNGSADIYFAASYDEGRSYTPDVRIDVGDPPGQFESFSPYLAAKGSRVYITWSDERNGDQRDILFNWSPNRGQTWAPAAIRVETDALGFNASRFPKVTLDDAGGAYFVWEDNRNGGFDIYYRKAVDGAFILEETRMDTNSPGAGNSLKPQIMVDGDNIAVLWEDRRSDVGNVGYNDLYYNFSVDGGVTWSKSDLRLDSLSSASSFKVDINGGLANGEIFALWADGRTGGSDVFFHRLTLGEKAEFVPIKE